MGCKFCTSGLGRRCDGPLGIDDLEVGCDCMCHKCDTCNSAHCVNVGGPDACDEAGEGGMDALEYDSPEGPDQIVPETNDGKEV